MFYIFKNYVKIGFIKAINEIAGTSLGIYILHEIWLFDKHLFDKWTSFNQICEKFDKLNRIEEKA